MAIVRRLEMRRRGFTLIELLIIGLLLPAVRKVHFEPQSGGSR